ncbi:MAG: M48 family metallopeptidase [Planctomycetes bacterium]|nr:M48 family metallopeptidase [Planctomycetota bacterium]
MARSPPMDFFDHQERARRKTGLLVVYLSLAVVLTVLAVCLVFALAVDRSPRGDPALFGGVALGTLLVIAAGTIYKLLALGSGGRAIAEGLGGEPVSAGTQDPRERRLLHVVEEMAIASGVPVPTVYRLPRETAINAFAAGTSTDHAVVAVTDGALRRLTRDELQGVIAHEFSHALNGDMRLNLRLIGLLHGILLLGLAGRAILRGMGRGRGGRKGSGGASLIVGLGLLVVGYVGYFFARLIKAAISRQREFLADASAVQFTRNPGGIAGALRKIGGLAEGSRLESPGAEEVSHMLFGEGIGQAFLQVLATHPPIADRIRRIDPSFDGRIEEVPPDAGDSDEAVAIELGLTPIARDAAPAGPAVPRPAHVAARVGTLTPERIRRTRAALASIPPSVVEAARDPFGAQAVVFGLLLHEGEEPRLRQWQALERTVEPAVLRETRRLGVALAGLARPLRLPVVAQTVPALRLLSPAQARRFSAAVDALVQADHRVSLFEFAVGKLLQRHVVAGRPGGVRFHGLTPLRGDLALLLSALARHGQREEAAVERAFQAGAARVAGGTGGLALAPREACTLRALDQALGRIDLAAPPVKRRVVDAVAHCAMADDTVTPAEAEVLRAVSNAIGCPMPPFVD